MRTKKKQKLKKKDLQIKTRAVMRPRQPRVVSFRIFIPTCYMHVIANMIFRF